MSQIPESLHCNACGCDWKPRGRRVPVRCARCKSTRWNVEFDSTPQAPRWHSHPASDKQIDLLRRSGYDCPPELTKGEASEMIEGMITASHQATIERRRTERGKPNVHPLTEIQERVWIAYQLEHPAVYQIH